MESTAQTRKKKEWLWSQMQARRVCWFVAPCDTVSSSGFASCAMTFTAAEALAFQTKSEKHCHVVILSVSCRLCRLFAGLLSASCWSLVGFLPASCCLQPAMTGHNRPLIGHSLVTVAECTSASSLFRKKCSLFVVNNDLEQWGGHALHCQPQSHLANTRCIETFHEKV